MIVERRESERQAENQEEHLKDVIFESRRFPMLRRISVFRFRGFSLHHLSTHTRFMYSLKLLLYLDLSSSLLGVLAKAESIIGQGDLHYSSNHSLGEISSKLSTCCIKCSHTFVRSNI